MNIGPHIWWIVGAMVEVFCELESVAMDGELAHPGSDVYQKVAQLRLLV